MSTPAMLDPGDPDFAFANAADNGEQEDELDAFNDETFGGGADEWAEETHEELAQLTEEERKALKASNDFFEFGSDDEGEALEPESDAGLEEAADQLHGALKPKPQTEKDRPDSLKNGDSSGLKQQLQQLNLGQVAAPLTIQTSQPALAPPSHHHHQHQQPQQQQQHAAPGVVYPAQAVHIVQQPHYQMQQIRYNLIPPGHFQAGADSASGHGGHPPPPPHHSQMQAAPPLQDPAIMSFSKVPMMGGFPPGNLHPPPPPHPSQHVQQPQPPIPAYHHPHHQIQQQQQQQQPPTVLGFKTMQDLENEMLYGKSSSVQSGAAQQPTQQPLSVNILQTAPTSQHLPPTSILQTAPSSGHQLPGGQQLPVGQQLPGNMLQAGPAGAHQPGFVHHPHQGINKQMLNNRNLNYPGMRDRQQQQAKPVHEQQQRGHQNSHHQHHHHQQHQGAADRNFHNAADNSRGSAHFQRSEDRFQRQDDRGHYQRSRDNMDNRRVQNDDHELRYNNNRRQDMRHQDNFRNQHHDRQFDRQDNFRSHHDNYRNQQDNYRHQQDNYRHQQDNYRHQQDNYRQSKDGDDDNWRWNEVRNRNRDSATRKDLMPGHVHTLGILRHSRARHVDPEDDCLGATDTAPLINPTGDPRLDARLASEQEELANRARWFNETEDEYAGLMSAREKQFIINIQLNQLKCDNPYVDDYYYTMFTAKKEKLEESESTGQMLLEDSAEQENSYIPMQFENSLGKLQVVTVKAPRQIIDVGVVRSDELGGSGAVTEANKSSPLPASGKPKRSEDYKSTLLQLEKMYSTLLDIESLKLKLSAIPTGAPLRDQVTGDVARQVQYLAASLAKSGLIPLYLQIRKGRGLLARALKHLPQTPVARISQEMLVHLWLVCKDGKSVELLWTHLYRHCNSSSLGNLEAAVNCWVKGREAALNTVLTTPLGVSTVLATLYRATSAAKRGQEKISVAVWRELIMKVISWFSGSGSSLASPLVTPQPLDIGFLLTLPDKQLAVWDSIMAAVGLDK